MKQEGEALLSERRDAVVRVLRPKQTPTIVARRCDVPEATWYHRQFGFLAAV
jgi:hypothetical protein